MSAEKAVHTQIQFFNWKAYSNEPKENRSPVSDLFNYIVYKCPGTFVCSLVTGIMACNRSSPKQREIIIKYAKQHFPQHYKAIADMGEYQR